MKTVPDGKKARAEDKAVRSAGPEKASRFAILGMLSLGYDTGYEIKKAIGVSTVNFWSESYGNIYPMLKRLVEEGAIRKLDSVAEPGGRRKQAYRITPHGRKLLKEWLRQPVRLPAPDNELLLKLFFGAEAQASEMKVIVAARRAELDRQLSHFAQIASYIASREATPTQKAYWMATLRYGKSVARAEIAWCEETERMLDGLAP